MTNSKSEAEGETYIAHINGYEYSIKYYYNVGYLKQIKTYLTIYGGLITIYYYIWRNLSCIYKICICL